MHFGRFASRKSEAKYPSLWDGLVGAWCPSVQNPSGNTLYDLSGYGKHFTFNNPSIASQWGRSGGRNAAVQDGSTSSRFLSNGLSYSFGACASLALWVRLNQETPSVAGNSGILQTLATTLGAGSHYPWTDGLAYMHTFRTARVNSISLSASVTRTNWHMVSFVTDGSRWTMRQNEIVVSDVAAESTVTFSSANFAIGRSSNSDTVFYYLDGEIDAIQLYNRAITPSEIRLLASQRGIAFTPKRRSVFRQLTNRLRSSRFAAFPA